MMRSRVAISKGLGFICKFLRKRLMYFLCKCPLLPSPFPQQRFLPSHRTHVQSWTERPLTTRHTVQAPIRGHAAHTRHTSYTSLQSQMAHLFNPWSPNFSETSISIILLLALLGMLRDPPGPLCSLKLPLPGLCTSISLLEITNIFIDCPST